MKTKAEFSMKGRTASRIAVISAEGGSVCPASERASERSVVLWTCAQSGAVSSITREPRAAPPAARGAARLR